MAMIRPDYIVVPHEVATGAECYGCLVVRTRDNVADLVCNICGVVVDTVPPERAGPRLMELALGQLCSARCPHCGALNTCTGFKVIEAFVCSGCGEGVSVEGSIQ
jgi:hypothetical protein